MSRTSANAASQSTQTSSQCSVRNPARRATRQAESKSIDVPAENALAEITSLTSAAAVPHPAAASAQSPKSLSSQTDQELLEGIRAQSERHFAELYTRYFQRIYNFVYARMRNHAETEEIVQETFLAVFRSFSKYRGQSSLLSWIYGIAKNTTNNNLRRAKSQHERIDLANEADLMPRQSLAVAPPDEQLDLYRFRDVLTSRLSDLAEWQTEIFEMRHFENLSIPEISERTTRSSDAVRSSLYRVKRIFMEAAEHQSPPVQPGASRAAAQHTATHSPPAHPPATPLAAEGYGARR